MEIRHVSPKELTSMSGNDLDDCDVDRVESLEESLSEQGYDEWEPMLVVGDDYRVVNGRHRTIASRRVGLDEVVVLHVTECELDELRDECGDDYERMTTVAEYRLEG